ncbi:MAG: flagellar hook-associated protein FlgK [Proteobacteria bacterium]|nr:flagellar hook-associated protein FlgK [Pseudomonadota bacterium]MBU1388930.1 flagellar hook-associated protein FlgK [Pseudomonadota bacterium]MBU1543482.1 flagellar hook-associated protein FlgK [Pseudomonadota bacterium]MBU2480226.1 flagellar hook-associated protein FlgK [Pseudomonadota bacterium]
MSGISSTLSIAKTAIAAQQYGLNITGQNIANVNNPNYSVQHADQVSMKPALYAGFLFGTGVNTNQIRQSVDNLLEQRLTSELSTQASFEEQESYMRILEGFFDENSQTSISTLLTEFWNSWQDLSDNPKGSSERVSVFENGKQLASRFEAAVIDMDDLSQDINADINSAVMQVNELSAKIARLNREVVSSEISRSANDLRDQRNRLVDELGKLIDIDTFEQPDGSLIVNVANSYNIVSGVETNDIYFKGKEVVWKSSASGDIAISDKISGGVIGGLLAMRDEVIPKYRSEIDELSREMIWAINYQHSQGAGLEYFKDAVTGDYAADESGWLTSLEFGDKIDFSQDFTMWTEDTTHAQAQYNKIEIDMGLSQASITNWQGTAPGGVQSIYKLTVLDGATLGDRMVTESDGDGLARVWGNFATSGVSSALDNAIAEQTFTIYDGPEGTARIQIKDVGGDARRSAASIAQALNDVAGIEAFASETGIAFDIAGIVNAQDGDEIQYSLYVDGLIQQVSFLRDSDAGTLQEQFEESLLSTVETINSINEDNDLFASGLNISSSSGRTLGVQDFEIQDNAGVSLSAFSGFTPGDILTFDVNGQQVSVDLTGVDTADSVAMAAVFSAAIAAALTGQPFSVENKLSSNSVVIRSTDGSDITLDNVSAIAGNPGVLITSLAGTTIPGDNTLTFDGADAVVANTDTVATDSFVFSGNGTAITIQEGSFVGGFKSGVITGTVTAVIDPAISIRSDVFGAASGGLFSGNRATVGSSIITLGGEGGFTNFSTAGGEIISFELDGAAISFVTTAAGGTSDIQFAQYLEAQINAGLAFAGIDQNYTVVRTASSVSIIKDSELEDPIEITNFADSLDNNAQLKIRTGTGKGSNQPENDLLDADPARLYRNFSTSTVYDDDGIIMWERLDKDGVGTGASGLIHVEDAGQVSIIESGLTAMTFDISKGSLVAGNTLSVNTDTLGRPDTLNFRITGQANSINDIYQFKVISGGKVGHVPAQGDDPIIIEWSNSVETGTFTIEGHDPPYTPGAPVEITVDGMLLRFYDGTVFDKDVFTITTGDTGAPLSTNSAGQPTGETLSDWHWTLDSFADQFNRMAGGMKASTTLDNRLQFAASDSYYSVENIHYSGENGFNQVNGSVTVTNYSAIDFAASDLHFERSASGRWGVLNDPTGGSLQIIPDGGDDDGFGVDFSGDGVADIEINFKERVSGYGFIEVDFIKHSSRDIGFSFSDNASSDSGLVAAAGINNFFKGYDSMTMEVNEKLSDTKFISAATIDSETGLISQGDNTNALAMSDVQFQEKTLKLWTFQRGSDARSSTTTATLDNYYNQMISSMGVKSRSIKNSKEFADIMVNSITAQRDSVSAVSLDEEMIKLIKYQHAFSAASKLLTIADEMLNTLISVR